MKKTELTREVQERLKEDIKEFFQEKRDEEISDYFADLLVKFMYDSIGPTFYNAAIKDAYAFMSGKVEDLFELEKKPRFK